MWLFLAAPILSWGLCLVGVMVYYTIVDIRPIGNMKDEWIALNNIIMTYAFFRWMGNKYINGDDN